MSIVSWLGVNNFSARNVNNPCYGTFRAYDKDDPENDFEISRNTNQDDANCIIEGVDD